MLDAGSGVSDRGIGVADVGVFDGGSNVLVAAGVWVVVPGTGLGVVRPTPFAAKVSAITVGNCSVGTGSGRFGLKMPEQLLIIPTSNRIQRQRVSFIADYRP